MKHFLFILLMAICSISWGQMTAVTENGDTIYVYNDGTWSYEPFGENSLRAEEELFGSKIELDTLEGNFSVPSSANKVAKSSMGFYEFHYDSRKWKRIPAGSLNEDAEMAFQHTEKDIYCMIIAEELEIGLENIFNIALSNMEENTGAEVEVMEAQLKNVNGTEMIRGVVDMNLSGMNLVFDSYYSSTEDGTIQLTVWTGHNLFDRYEDIIEDLHNGLVLTPSED